MVKRVRKLPILVLACWSAGFIPSADAQALTASTGLMPRVKPAIKVLHRKSLTAVLADYEKQHRVSFNYDNELLAPILTDLQLLGSQASLDQSLQGLLAPHKLTFEKISPTDIIIYPVPVPAREATTAPLSTPVQQAVERVISGKVSSKSGEGLPGVTVLLKGTSIGATTGTDGSFSLTVPDGGGTLIFSFIGFATREVAIPASGKLHVTLEEDAKALEEVVVVGFGTQKKVNLTGAVSAVSAETLTSRPVGQTSAALQGIASGVTVVQSSGQPGADAGTIRIRGIGTLGNSNPLVLIDGIEGSMNSIDPNLIESISVLKDAASASIYGSRAANGVILVTTKRAKSNQLSITTAAIRASRSRPTCPKWPMPSTTCS
jgi:TonB-dependent SusC/RagA subfamily outer membrane receptor